MTTFLITVHVITCCFLVLLVLIQSGKGAEISASFGGSSQTVFGSSGGANFFTRATAIMAVIFMCTSISLTLRDKSARKSVFSDTPAAPVEKSESVPAAPTEAPAPVAPAKK